MKRALITGISGQDGGLLANLLLSKGYHVMGTSRGNDKPLNLRKLRIEREVEMFHSPESEEDIGQLLKSSKPDEIYNLSAQSSVKKSFDSPLETAKINAFVVAYILEAVRLHSPGTHFFQASSSEIFGSGEYTEESLPILPQNPYSISKAYAHLLTQKYRSLYGLFTVCGVLFNHDSEFRGDSFFTKQVARHVALYSKGKRDRLGVGNIYAQRDIGYAPEYVNAMYLTLQHRIPQDYIISTGRTEVIKNFINYCFKSIYVDIEWRGTGVEEKAYDAQTGEILVEIQSDKFRPQDMDIQSSKPTRIEKELGWKAKKTMAEIAEIMVKYEIENHS